MARPKSKCKDCKDRVQGCHDICESYKEFANALEKWKVDKKEFAEKQKRYFSRGGYKHG